MAKKALAECKKYAITHGETHCMNPECKSGWALGFAHRQKRRFYHSVEELSDPIQFMTLCAQCHNEIEFSKEKTEKLFIQIRGI